MHAIEVKFYDMLSSGQGYTEHLGVQIVRTIAPIVSLDILELGKSTMLAP